MEKFFRNILKNYAHFLYLIPKLCITPWHNIVFVDCNYPALLYDVVVLHCAV